MYLNFFRKFSIQLFSFLAVYPVDSFAETILISAASSLREAFSEISSRFQSEHPGVEIKLVFGASSSLLQQVEQGAPADVLALADFELFKGTNIDKSEKFADVNIFAKNKLVLIQSTKNAQNIASLDQIDNKGIKRIAIGNPSFVPAGRYARDAIKSQGLWQKVENKMIYTHNVRQALDYVARGEVDLGFVYFSDAKMMEKKVKIILSIDQESEIRYGIASVSRQRANDLSAKFVHFVMAPQGQLILKNFGFIPAKN